MKPFYRIVCRLLILSIGALPYTANAGMIGTGEALSGVQSAAAGNPERESAARAQLTRELGALGVPAASAEQRVAAMTGDEVNQLCEKLDTLPAAGVSPWAIALVVLFIAGLLYQYFGPDRTWANRPL